MRSFTAISCEMNDIDIICTELTESLKKNLELGEHTIGIAICDSAVDYPQVIAQLSKLCAFEIIGCTPLGFVHPAEEADISVSLTVFTGDDDFVCSAALTQPITMGNKEQVIAQAYRKAREALEGEPKLMLTMQTYSAEITPDLTTDILDRESNHCPQYGAISFSDWDTGISEIFIGGKAYENRLVILLLGGKLRPVFASEIAQIKQLQARAVITEAQNNTVYKVGEHTMLDLMKKNGLTATAEEVVNNCAMTYTANPVLTYPKGKPEERELRNVLDVDFETGAVTFTGSMTKGHELVICALTMDAIRRSSMECFENLTARILENQKDGYAYSTLFAIVCGGRYLVMAGDPGTDVTGIRQNAVLHELTLCGFYAMGEICPDIPADGTVLNRALHSSITLLAL